MASIGEILGVAPSTYTIVVNDRDITFTYWASRVTPEWEARLQAAENDDKAAEVLGEVLESWDLHQEAPGDWPVSTENLKRTPAIIMGLIAGHLMNHAFSSVRAEGKSLGATSPPTVSSDPSQTGMNSSPQPSSTPVPLTPS